MQSSRLNLNDKIADHFEFTIGGVDFNLKYPTLEELEPVQAINSERAEAVSKNDTEAIARCDKKLEEVFYSLIYAVDGKSKIDDVLKKQPFPVVKKFNKMIAEQLSVD